MTIPAQILPLGKVQFLDGTGTPFALGRVYFYIPDTTVFKNTFKDREQTILNTNPVVLDSEGRAVIWGSGVYRQILTDSLGNTIWDKVVSTASGNGGIDWGSVGGGTANAQTVALDGGAEIDGTTFEYIPGTSNTGPTTISVNAGLARKVMKNSPAGPVDCTGGELIEGNIVRLVWVTALGAWVLVEGGGDTIDGLSELTNLAPADFIPVYHVDSDEEKKITAQNFFRGVKFLNKETDPDDADRLLWVNVAADKARYITYQDSYKAVKTLTPHHDITDDDYIPIYAASADTGRKVSARTISPWTMVTDKTVGSGDPSFEILNQDLSRFQMLRITFMNILSEDDDVRISLSLSTDNGDTWETTNYLNADTTVTNGFALVPEDLPASNGLSNAANSGGLNGVIYIANCSEENMRKTASGIVTWKESAADVSSFVVTGVSDELDAVNAFRLHCKDDNLFTTGRIIVEGLI